MLLTGNRALGSPRNMANQARTGIYRMARGGSTWTLLRGKVRETVDAQINFRFVQCRAQKLWSALALPAHCLCCITCCCCSWLAVVCQPQVLQPAKITDKPWQYPTAFAVDWTKGSPGNRCVTVQDWMVHAPAAMVLLLPAHS